MKCIYRISDLQKKWLRKTQYIIVAVRNNKICLVNAFVNPTDFFHIHISIISFS